MLDWIGKIALLNRHRQVSSRLPHCNAKLEVRASTLPGKGQGEGLPLACVIYGERYRLGPARLKREGIVFRQIPYEIKTT